MRDDQLTEQLKAATERRRQTPPEKRFQDLVDRGVIDENGKVLVRMPIGSPKDARELEESDGRGR
jgi:hypothetical protein